MKHKAIILLPSLLGLSLFSTPAFAAWTFNQSVEVANSTTVVVSDWEFEESTLDSGTIIEVDEDGNITINGETAEGEINSEGTSYSNGDVTITVTVDEDGNVVLSEFTTTTTSSFWALFGSDIYLPTSVTIDGTTYAITGVSEPLDISLSSTWLGTNTIYVPEGYTYLCDGAFASITTKATFELPSTLVSIGSKVFMPGRNVTQTINYAGSQDDWEAIDIASDYENGRGSLTINYES